MYDTNIKQVLVTGGAGYVGSVLVPKLLAEGCRVKVLDLFMFGEDVLNPVGDDPNLEQIKGDIRDRSAVEQAVRGCEAVIPLACISNDPSFELDPDLGKSINYDTFSPACGRLQGLRGAQVRLRLLLERVRDQG